MVPVLAVLRAVTVVVVILDLIMTKVVISDLKMFSKRKSEINPVGNMLESSFRGYK